MNRFIGFYHIQLKTKYLLIGLVALMLVGSSAMYVQGYNKQKPIFEVKTSEPKIALTFDISWGNKTPLPVLDILKANDIRCTFFLSGPWVKQYPEIAKRILEDGHEIGSHGYRHINLSTIGHEEIVSELSKAHEIIKDVTGVEANLIRTPNGDYSNTVIDAIQSQNYKVIQWSLDSLDWMNPGINTISSRVISKCKAGDIILMHASDTCKQTDQALPEILKELKAKGFEFVKVSELLNLEGAN